MPKIIGISYLALFLLLSFNPPTDPEPQIIIITQNKLTEKPIEDFTLIHEIYDPELGEYVRIDSSFHPDRNQCELSPAFGSHKVTIRKDGCHVKTGKFEINQSSPNYELTFRLDCSSLNK